MTRRFALLTYGSAILFTLLLLELTRRGFNFFDCYLSYRSDPSLFFAPQGAIARECVRRTLLFPLYL